MRVAIFLLSVFILYASELSILTGKGFQVEMASFRFGCSTSAEPVAAASPVGRSAAVVFEARARRPSAPRSRHEWSFDRDPAVADGPSMYRRTLSARHAGPVRAGHGLAGGPVLPIAEFQYTLGDLVKLGMEQRTRWASM